MPFVGGKKSTALPPQYDQNKDGIIDNTAAISDGNVTITPQFVVQLDETKLDKDGPIDGGGF
jgi:hypothetical protein